LTIPVVGRPTDNPERRDRTGIAALLGWGELFLNSAVAVTLSIGGIVLFAAVVYDFLRHLGDGPFVPRLLDLLSGLLLVFIFTELIITIRVVIASRTVEVEPFLIVGIVAAIRRVIVISAEAQDLLGTARFRDVLLEIAVLSGTVLVLGVTVFVLRRAPSREGEPTPGTDQGTVTTTSSPT
jgi:uncharacterized membrane protein (DUF373 family)